MYSVEHSVFTALVAAVSVVTTVIRPVLYKTQKSWLHVMHKNVQLYGILYTSMSVLVNPLRMKFYVLFNYTVHTAQ
jgi:hypothetical protein